MKYIHKKSQKLHPPYWIFFLNYTKENAINKLQFLPCQGPNRLNQNKPFHDPARIKYLHN